MPLPEAKWNCKILYGYDKTDVEAQQNAVMCWAILGAQGWTLNAVCGLWGNVEAESGFNPWRWQSDVVLNSSDSRIDYSSAHAYGLCQWDPAGKYIHQGGNEFPGYGPNFSDEQGSLYDGTAQMLFLDSDADYIPTASYPISYADYKHSIGDPRELAKAWLLNFERPLNQSQAAQDYRASLALWWWNFLAPQTPISPSDPVQPITPPSPPPVPPQPWDIRKSKFMFYLKPTWKQIGGY